MIRKIILILIFTAPALFADDPKESTEVKSRFINFVEKINKGDIGFVDEFDEKSVQILRNRLQSSLLYLGKSISTITGLPEEYPKLEDRKFVEIVFSYIFKNHPNEFKIPSAPSVHGVVFDSDLAFLVYSFKSDDSQSITPSVMAFKKSKGAWKVSSISFDNSVIKIWNLKNQSTGSVLSE